MSCRTRTPGSRVYSLLQLESCPHDSERRRLRPVSHRQTQVIQLLQHLLVLDPLPWFKCGDLVCGATLFPSHNRHNRQRLFPGAPWFWRSSRDQDRDRDRDIGSSDTAQ